MGLDGQTLLRSNSSQLQVTFSLIFDGVSRDSITADRASSTEVLLMQVLLTNLMK
jgi:hypothetical protein